MYDNEQYSEIPAYTKDISYAYMIDTNDVDIYDGVSCAAEIIEDKKNSFSKCITLASALQLVSQSIGENSQYSITSIDTIYRNKTLDDSGSNLYGTPCWKISGINNSSGGKVSFFINMKTGELDYETYTITLDSEENSQDEE